MKPIAIYNNNLQRPKNGHFEETLLLNHSALLTDKEILLRSSLRLTLKQDFFKNRPLPVLLVFQTQVSKVRCKKRNHFIHFSNVRLYFFKLSMPFTCQRCEEMPFLWTSKWPHFMHFSSRRTTKCHSSCVQK